MRNTRTILVAAILAQTWLVGCGGAPVDTRAPDGVSGATDLAPPPPRGAEPGPTVEAAAPTSHVCEASIGAPEDVWLRIEAVRALPAEERAAKCGLDLIPIIAAWRSVPVDILAPIVERAAADPTALDAWVADKAQNAPKAAADVVAMDVVGRFAVGGDSKEVEARRMHWSGVPAASVPEVAAMLEEAKLLPKLLGEVNAVHELRCLLEVNALGFAVKCTPIHPATTPISLNWTTAVRDGVLEKLELTSCTGSKSCPKLKKTAEKLVTRYRALVEEVGKLKTSVYSARLLALMELPPFKGRSAVE
jgi:hypothetical protein